MSIIAVVAAVLALTVAPEKANAAFPGKNGKIVFESVGVTDHVTTVSATGKGLRELPVQGFAAQWSADGRRLVFRWRRPGSRWVIGIMRANGSGAHRVRNTLTNEDREPTWSPNGRRIAFARNSEGFGPSHIWTIGTDGSKLHRVTRFKQASEDDFESQPAWSANGRWIAFRRERKFRHEIWITDANGKHPRRLSHTDGHAEAPDWSPDSSRIVFVNSSTGSLMTVTRRGSQRVLLPGGAFSAIDPAWSPNGRRIVFTRYKTGGSTIGEGLFTIKPNGSGLHRLTTGDHRNADWQPLRPRHKR